MKTRNKNQKEEKQREVIPQPLIQIVFRLLLTDPNPAALFSL